MKRDHAGFAILMLAVLLSACGLKTQATPTTDPNIILTSVAQTAAARLAALPSATLAPTSTPAPTTTPTSLPTPTSFSPVITGTLPIDNPSQTIAAPTGVVSGADQVLMVSDLDVTDGTQFDPGAKFTKKWRLMNTGTTTWTTGYSLVHVSGDDIKGPASLPLPIEVGPGKIVDVGVELIAPTKDGKYTSYWKLKNANGQLFGIGVTGKDAFWVQIQVGGDANPAPTDTPVGTPSSATVTPSATIRHLRLAVDNDSVTAACPYTFTFTASFRLSAAAMVTYHWEASDSMYSMPAALSVSMPAGDQTIPFSFGVTSGNSGWVKFHITAPEDTASDPVDFSLTCTP
jgi:hypothetical protein